ncbi:hypothetical protein LTR97_001034 [Elasticomyces elasticus]|uniref:Uncharacterized protein n=1 Tax=Elasticomyces elasticus TaxID=574655 RepID=A0AAN7VVP3_9PEZI|nr:hypothetical protein LTR97_001034 [Elasticomyces elasticus]
MVTQDFPMMIAGFAPPPKSKAKPENGTPKRKRNKPKPPAPTTDSRATSEDTEAVFPFPEPLDSSPGSGAAKSKKLKVTTEQEDTVIDETDSAIDEAVVLDPVTSKRRYCHDPFTNIKREVWRPGDGDGLENADFHGRIGPPLPLEQRWRLYQSSNAEKVSKTNAPPAFVLLDDRAAREVVESDIPARTKLRNWPWDFAKNGDIRSRRPHCGRPAIRNARLIGNERYYWSLHGSKKERYYFTGEKDYQPIVYKMPKPTPPKPSEEELLRLAAKKRKLTPDPENPRRHGHNQHTPKNELVKYGAPGFSASAGKYKKRIGGFLYQDPKGRDLRTQYGAGGYHHATNLLASTVGAGGAVTGDATGTGPFTARDDDDEDIWYSKDDNSADQNGEEGGSMEVDEEGALASIEAGTDAVQPSEEHDDVFAIQKKPAQRISYLEQAAAADYVPIVKPVQTSDSGSYALQLEGQVLQHECHIQELLKSLNESQARNRELEREVMMLRGMERSEDDDDEAMEGVQVENNGDDGEAADEGAEDEDKDEEEGEVEE